ncbi:hypothetical protein BDU57DRAFT_47891 [Ampelomyces quisqualis]|uniref:Uncharacterized protein n=1 Tax=Ampelomyces quisqualis TaxID=50730 RepID=A0A6A5R2K7_AMPQU|nr:hypothetical protein BDU57DRAFT_47891 [Ampelomyces quisqualis]
MLYLIPHLVPTGYDSSLRVCKQGTIERGSFIACGSINHSHRKSRLTIGSRNQVRCHEIRILARALWKANLDWILIDLRVTGSLGNNLQKRCSSPAPHDWGKSVQTEKRNGIFKKKLNLPKTHTMYKFVVDGTYGRSTQNFQLRITATAL